MKKQALVLTLSLLFSVSLAAQTYANADHSQVASSGYSTHAPSNTNPSEKLLTHHTVSDYIAANLKYPVLAEEAKVEGTVIAKVLIGTDGRVVHAEILESPGYGCDEMVLQLLQEMPRWAPYVRNGKPVTQELQIPVRFNLR